ncbi:MAG TPA: cobalamin B12-binding domain-containing protein [Syntrophales bacterium]|nr:cobalamin B12-binding domain-containing protein [Syntrophales bacterium]HQM90280.1 cobalamin B12-binding domain-containing protein [Syntrophales bacterium]HQM90339.1 cobalamin B12-binding domain-containing protein [Syntrophales bacterium]
MAERKLRVMVAKPGLDGHDRGARVLARCFRDAGYEVIYTGCHQTPEQIVSAVIQEDVDLLGLSCLSGAHRYLYPAVTKLMKEKGIDDVTVIGGGIIPDQDFQLMYDAGLKAIFTPGTTLESIINWINTNVKPRN